MLEALLGDACWYEETQAKTGEAITQTTLKDENPLLHGFRSQLQAGAGLLRTPTRFAGRSFLAPWSLAERVEAVCNISLNAARQANQVMGHDAVICGVVGPLAEAPLDADQVHKAVGEPAIYLLDKGADCLSLEGFTNLESFRWGMECLKMVNNVPVPLSGFLDLQGVPTAVLLAGLELTAAEVDLELVGLELSLAQALQLPPAQPGSCGWGWMIKAGPDLPPAQRQQALQTLLSYDPSLILGGTGLSTAAWGLLMQELQAGG